MSRVFDLPVDQVYGQKVHHTQYLRPVARAVMMLALGVLQQNVPAGGSDTVGQDASATGDYRLLDWFPILNENASAQFSGFTDNNSNSAVYVARFRYKIRVSNSGITITPKVWYGASISTITNAATITDENGDPVAACNVVDADPPTYTGAHQYQEVWVTEPSGAKLWIPGYTVGGAPAANYQAWVSARWDRFVRTSP